MAFSELDRVEIRSFLGFSRLQAQEHPKLENAITTVQSITDGGSFPDSSTETAIKATVVLLKALDVDLANLRQTYIATAAGTKQIDGVRAAAQMRSDGRRLVAQLATYLNVRPLRDYYASVPSSGSRD